MYIIIYVVHTCARKQFYFKKKKNYYAYINEVNDSPPSSEIAINSSSICFGIAIYKMSLRTCHDQDRNMASTASWERETNSHLAFSSACTKNYRGTQRKLCIKINFIISILLFLFKYYWVISN